MIPKATPAERRESDRAAYHKRVDKLRTDNYATIVSLGRYVGAMNAGFAIGAAGFISQLSQATPVPVALKVIFALAIVGVISGAITLLGIVWLSEHMHDRFNDRWRPILKGYQRRRMGRPGDPNKRTLRERARYFFEEGRKGVRSVADIVTAGNPKLLPVLLLMSQGIYLSVACAFINSALAVMAIASM